MPDNFFQQLMARVRGQRPVPPPASTGVDELRPWDSPVLRAAAPTLTQIPPEMMEEPGIAPSTPGAPVTSADDALVQALLRKRINQRFAGATGQPIPQ